MTELFDALNKAWDFVQRRPKLVGSHLLKKEAATLIKALGKYNAKAEELDLSFAPNYAEAAALIEGDGKGRVTVKFIKDFTRKHCSSQLFFERADKRARLGLLTLAARDRKLEQLLQALDQNQKYREMFQELLEAPGDKIKAKLLAMPPKEFSGLVTVIGLDAPRTNSGAVSTSRASREKVLKQILSDKTSEELMSGLGRDV